MRGFSGTTTNLVVSLLVNLIIFSFLVLAPSPSLSLSPRLASLSRAPSPSFYPLVSYLPPHFSIAPLTFPAIDPPLCLSAQKRMEIPPPSRSGLLSLLFTSLLPSLLSVCTFCTFWPSYFPEFFPPLSPSLSRSTFAVTSRRCHSCHSALSDARVLRRGSISQHPGDSIRWTRPGLSYTLPSCVEGESARRCERVVGEGGRGEFQFSKMWRGVSSPPHFPHPQK